MPYVFRLSDLPKLDLDVDRGTDFTAWTAQWTSYSTLSGLSEEPAATKVQALTLCFSRETLTVVDNLGITTEERNDSSAIIAALKRHVEGHINESMERRRSSSLRTHLDPSSQRALDLGSAKGASNWLTTLPLQEHGFALHKSAFHDAVALRYGWSPQRTPAHCACGTSFSVEHALSCPKGGLLSIRHNEIRYLTATLLTEVCSQVAVGPELQLVSQQDYPASANIQDGARLDIAINGFWGGRSERCFVDVRVFNLLAASNASSSLASCYQRHENIKKRAYAQRIREEEHASFTPLVMSASGGLAHEASVFINAWLINFQTSGAMITLLSWGG